MDEPVDFIAAGVLKKKICEVLGLDPGRVNQIVIDIRADYDPILVEVTMFGGSGLVNVEWSPKVMEVHIDES